MNKSLLLAFIYLVTLLSAVNGQNYNVIIEGRIVGYDCQKEIPYALSDVAGARGTHTIKPDSLGRFVIKANIKGTKFFSMYCGQNNINHHCKLILKPNTGYSFISEGMDKNDWRIVNSPDIYTIKLDEELKHCVYTLDKGQMAYSSINNGIHGFIFNDEWDLKHPESVLDSLETKIDRELSMVDQLLERKEISQEFYDICKLNIEYMYAEQLASMISGIKYTNDPMVGIKDSVLREKLHNIYPKIFEKYPINEENARLLGNMFFYTELYLTFLEDYKDGIYKPVIRKGNKAFAHIHAKSGTILPEDVNMYYQQEVMMGNAAALGTVTSEHIRKYLTKSQDLKDTYGGKLIEEVLLHRVEEYEQLAFDPLPDGCYILDGDTINSFKALSASFKGKPLLIDCWGTWCPGCRSQFYYMEEIKTLMQKKDMKMIYLAWEYDENNQLWESMMKSYDLKGYHFVANDNMKADLIRLTGDDLTFPNFIIIDALGKVVDVKAAMPSDGDKLYKQIENLIK